MTDRNTPDPRTRQRVREQASEKLQGEMTLLRHRCNVVAYWLVSRRELSGMERELLQVEAQIKLVRTAYDAYKAAL